MKLKKANVLILCIMTISILLSEITSFGARFSEIPTENEADLVIIGEVTDAYVNPMVSAIPYLNHHFKNNSTLEGFREPLIKTIDINIKIDTVTKGEYDGVNIIVECYGAKATNSGSSYAHHLIPGKGARVMAFLKGNDKLSEWVAIHPLGIVPAKDYTNYDIIYTLLNGKNTKDFPLLDSNQFTEIKFKFILPIEFWILSFLFICIFVYLKKKKKQYTD